MTDEGSLPNSFQFFDRIRFRGEPLANAESMVTFGQARFTVLTPRLLRLEWSDQRVFEDRGSFAFTTRYAATPPCRVSTEGRTLHLDTDALSLTYRDDSARFSSDNLAIALSLDGRRVDWVPGMQDTGNLRGTRRTLDGCAGDASLEPGILSRSGWALFDDSGSVVFDPVTGWVQPRSDLAALDWYFFAYGHDNSAALADYRRFGGAIPLIPRFVLGAWWSRYWAYSAEDLRELVHEFELHDLPLDVLVLDMDWHTPHSWTGYTWNRDLFPDPRAFIDWAHGKGLRITLNLHPAQGVQPFEEIYPRFAEAMGLGPSAATPIAFRVADPRFVRSYFELLHHPLEEDGVDFWWLDWQQGEASEMEGLDPLPWLNHLHFSDSARRGQRPMLYSRWGGLGNHRYPIGFSGDTYVTWDSLQFQPYFTATAANVAYGWWSHDIGGHMGGATEPELFARWVQFGALSPVLRLHATKDPRAERQPWKYPEGVYRAASEAFHLRYQLVPYLYTLARVAADTGLSPCRPMYYADPRSDHAYAARHQMLLGDHIIAAPIVYPADSATGLASTDVWCPEGTWIDYQTKETLEGPCWVRLVGDIHRVPMLVKAGTILPLAAGFSAQPPPRLSSGTTDALPGDHLVVSVFPGTHGEFCIYEDDGKTLAYLRGEFEWTRITTSIRAPGHWQVTIAPVEGHSPDLPGSRAYEIRLEGSKRPHTVLLDGEPTSEWTYDARALRTVIQVPASDKRSGHSVAAVADGPIVALGDEHNHRLVQADVQRLLGARFPPTDGLRELLEWTLDHADAPGALDALGRLGGPFVRFLEFSTLEEASNSLGRVIVAAPVSLDEPFDLEIDVSLERFGQREQHPLRLCRLHASQIVDLPIAFDGSTQPLRWEAEARLTWLGRTVSLRHRSQPLFQTVPVWKVLIRDRSNGVLPLQGLLERPGSLPDPADWKLCTQVVAELSSLRQPHHIRFWKSFPEEIVAASRPEAYLTTTVVCPSPRDAQLEFSSAGPLEVHLNGRRIALLPFKPEPGIPRFFREPVRSETLRLIEGDNKLVVRTEPPGEGTNAWFLLAMLGDERGEPMVDVRFSLR